MPSKFAYWKIRGLAHPIRLLLNYVGEDYEENPYVCGEAPDFSRDSWLKEKNTLGLDFPNLPYYIDEDVKLTQTNAILRYLARKHNLDGSTVAEKAHNDLLLDQIMDLRNSFVSLCYGKPYNEQIKANYVENKKKSMEDLEKYLGDKKFFIGDKPMVCDFHIYEMLEQHRLFEPSLLKDRKKLLDYLKRFEELPTIKKYMSSDKFFSRPVNNPMANFI